MGGLNPPRPLTSGDDRAAFDCGKEALNQWFRRHALRNQQTGMGRTHVVTTERGDIAAYLTLCAAEIARDLLSPKDRRNAPRKVPVLLLAQLAVDLRHQRQGYGKAMLALAFRNALAFADEIGCYAIITHPIDDDVRRFYADAGFESLAGDSEVMLIRLSDIQASEL